MDSTQGAAKGPTGLSDATGAPVANSSNDPIGKPPKAAAETPSDTGPLTYLGPSERIKLAGVTLVNGETQSLPLAKIAEVRDEIANNTGLREHGHLFSSAKPLPRPDPPARDPLFRQSN